MSGSNLEAFYDSPEWQKITAQRNAAELDVVVRALDKIEQISQALLSINEDEASIIHNDIQNILEEVDKKRAEIANKAGEKIREVARNINQTISSKRIK